MSGKLFSKVVIDILFCLIFLTCKALAWSYKKDADIELKRYIFVIQVWLWRGYGAPYTQRGDNAHRTTRQVMCFHIYIVLATVNVICYIKVDDVFRQHKPSKSGMWNHV